MRFGVPTGGHDDQGAIHPPPRPDGARGQGGRRPDPPQRLRVPLHAARAEWPPDPPLGSAARGGQRRCGGGLIAPGLPASPALLLRLAPPAQQDLRAGLPGET